MSHINPNSIDFNSDTIYSFSTMCPSLNKAFSKMPFASYKSIKMYKTCEASLLNEKKKCENKIEYTILFLLNTNKTHCFHTFPCFFKLSQVNYYVMNLYTTCHHVSK